MGADDRRERPFIDQAPWIGLMPGICLCALLISVTCSVTDCALLDPRLSSRG
ncbi:MAG: hypothetical protein M5U08_13955 [Burkholderiales bacterium]|nr:hypothetical protein [Burkholderiales bacterium]